MNILLYAGSDAYLFCSSVVNNLYSASIFSTSMRSDLVNTDYCCCKFVNEYYLS